MVPRVWTENRKGRGGRERGLVSRTMTDPEMLRTHHARRLMSSAAGIAEAARLIRAGKLVAFPTETVYGLGAHAFDVAAVARIFRAKERPREDPLIVHVARTEDVSRVAEMLPLVPKLAEIFWPGPLTLLLPKKPVVPSIVTAGLPTVGVRVPRHPTALALLAEANVPIAAPSANLFTRPSPTHPEHVLDDLGHRIDAVLDGGPTDVGVESTILDLTTATPRLLRPGGVPREALEAALGCSIAPPPTGSAHGPLRAPGLLETHYAPRTPLVLVRGATQQARGRLWEEVTRAKESGRRVGLLLLDEDVDLVTDGVRTVRLGAWSDPEGSARRLFDALRSLDRDGLDVLFARDLADPDSGLGQALADRLGRAAARVVTVPPEAE